MSVRNLVEGYATLGEPETSTSTGVLSFSGAISGQVRYTLNQIGNSFTLTLNDPFNGIVSNSLPITAPNITGITQQINQQIILNASDGSTAAPRIGLISITQSTITIYSDIESSPFIVDSANLQGWNNGFSINFSV